jgi:hypothetical protein
MSRRDLGPLVGSAVRVGLLREDLSIGREGTLRLNLEGADWAVAATSLLDAGFVRLEGAVPMDLCREVAAAAPATWEVEQETIGNVRQCATSTGLYLDRAAEAVRQLGAEICDSLSAAFPPGTTVPPLFNEVRWSKSEAGPGHSITAHRDPPLCGGVIAVVTLSGHAVFRVWSGEAEVAWTTAAGDAVLLRGNGWPTEHATCLVHEAELPEEGERLIVTLRHNTGGPGADYFAAIR